MIRPHSTLRMGAEKVSGIPIHLGSVERRVVEAAICEVCAVRGDYLFALNVRTNHAHIVVNNAMF